LQTVTIMSRCSHKLTL